MEKLLSLTVSGAVNGAIFSLIAAGLVLTYSTSGVFNLAHGAIAFTTAFVFYELNSALHWPIVPAAIVSIGVFAPLLGLVLDRLMFRHLSRLDDTSKIVATVGLLIALPALTLFVVERLINTFHFGLLDNESAFAVPGLGPIPKNQWQLIEGVPFDSDQLVVIIAAGVAALTLWVVVRHTRLGLHMRATVDRPDLAAMRGVDPSRTSAVAWVLGTMLAGLAGVVAAVNPAFGLKPDSYTLLLFIAATAAVAARFRSIPLAFVAGLVLGVIRNLVQGYLTFGAGIPGLRSSAPFWLLFVALFFLARDRSRRASTASSTTPPPDYLADLPAWRRALPWAIAGVLLLAYSLFAASTIWQGIIMRGLALALIFLSFVVVTGVGGMVSLAQATFVTAGAMTAGLLLSHGWPFVPALVAGALSAAVLGGVVSLPALRLGGLPLALSTLALAYIGDQVLFQVDAYRNDEIGWSVSRPSFGPFDFNDDRSMIVLLIVLACLTAALVRNLQRSASGRAMVAVRAAEVAAATSGISPMRTKLWLFGISAFIAGVGGVMYASVEGQIGNLSHPPLVGLIWLAVAVLFGVRRPGGAIVAGIVFMAFPRILSAGLHWPDPVPSWLSWDGTTSTLIPSILFGWGAINLARKPDGMLSDIAEARHHARSRRAAKLEAVRAAEDATIDATIAHSAERLHATGIVDEPSTAAAVVPDAALVFDDVHAGYGDVRVLHGIRLAVPRGKIVALLGANGAGKSTLCAVAAGLVTPGSGHVMLNGVDVTGLRAHQRAARGLVVAPESRGVFPGLTVDENLALWLPSEDQRTEAYHAFPLLYERRRLPAGNLSGGEQQMLTLAPVVIRPPDVLVADEPTLGLAPMIIDQITTIFTDLRDRGVSILLVEEKSRDVLRIADIVAFLELGHVVWSGPRVDVDDDRLAAAYLGAARA